MRRPPFALVAKVEIAERRSQRKVPIVGAGTPGGRALLQVIEGTIDLGLMALLPGGVPPLLRAKALLVDEQQRRIEDAVRQGQITWLSKIAVLASTISAGILPSGLALLISALSPGLVSRARTSTSPPSSFIAKVIFTLRP
jgi:hypothetical protein